jgi:acyl-[acyl-carrier-protein]-phospholipid O-acyltransferase / long-chain-fatty-acid--[acyl-carrier-protein] ligase
VDQGPRDRRDDARNHRILSASIPFLFFVLLFTATHSAFFSPAKYGILPEVFADDNLSAANGILELTTDLAILIGAILGVYVYSLFASNLSNAGLVFAAIACLGTTAILFVPRVPSGNREANFAWNVFRSFGSDFAEVRRSSILYYTLVGCSALFYQLADTTLLSLLGETRVRAQAVEMLFQQSV